MRIRFLTAVMAGMMVCLCAAPVLAGDPLKSAAKSLAKGVKKLENKKLAVLSFPYHGGALSSGSSLVPERLTTYLAERKGIQVVERSLLHKVLEEMEFQQISAIDQETAQELGKFLGVEAIVTGSLFDHADGKTEVNARLIEAQTGAVLSAKRIFVKRSWTDEPKKVMKSLKKKKNESDHANEPEKVIVITNREQDYSGPPESGGWDGGRPRLRGEGYDRPMTIDKARQIYVHSRVPHERARALLMMGKLREKQGNRLGARKAYEQVIREFPDQKRIVQQARQRLKQLFWEKKQKQKRRQRR